MRQLYAYLLQMNRPIALYVFCQTEGHFACACVHPLNGNSVGALKSDGGRSKTRVKFQSF